MVLVIVTASSHLGVWEKDADFQAREDYESYDTCVPLDVMSTNTDLDQVSNFMHL